MTRMLAWITNFDTRRTLLWVVLSLLASMSGGCAEAVPIFGDFDENVEEACELLDVACEHTSERYGSIELTIVDLPELTCPCVKGQTETRWCERQIWVDRDPLLIAHELGHALRLGHVDAVDNLMHRSPDYAELTDAQYDTIQDEGARLLACRP